MLGRLADRNFDRCVIAPNLRSLQIAGQKYPGYAECLGRTGGARKRILLNPRARGMHCPWRIGIEAAERLARFTLLTTGKFAWGLKVSGCAARSFQTKAHQV